MSVSSEHGSPHKVIVIGASRGGISAVRQVLEPLAEDFAGTVLIALHPRLDTAKTGLSDWRHWTRLPVVYAEDASRILAGHVYLTPPHQQLEVHQNHTLGLVGHSAQQSPEHWADHFFTSAAAAYGERTIGVVLTGGDSDGSIGMKAIHIAGGTGIVQEPSDALDPSMPLSSLRIDHPDYCLPLREIGELLNKLTTP